MRDLLSQGPRTTALTPEALQSSSQFFRIIKFPDFKFSSCFHVEVCTVSDFSIIDCCCGFNFIFTTLIIFYYFFFMVFSILLYGTIFSAKVLIVKEYILFCRPKSDYDFLCEHLGKKLKGRSLQDGLQTMPVL